MRVQTLKSYTRKNLNSYLSTMNVSTCSYSVLLERSKKDDRLAELSQAFFFAQEKMLEANMFSHFTDESYATYKEYLASDSKSVVLFNEKVRGAAKYKDMLRNMVEKLRKALGYTYYKLSKLLNTSQSNVTYFFKNKEDNKLSTVKLEELLKLLKAS